MSESQAPEHLVEATPGDPPPAADGERPATPEISGKLTGHTRRNFIRGIAAAGVSTATAVSLDTAGITDLFSEDAGAQAPATEFSAFSAIAASSQDAFQVPEGFRADIVIGFRDTFKNGSGAELPFGYNNDFLAYFPLNGSQEGLLFVNHEYPEPFFQHGYKKSDVNPGKHTKSAAEVQLEQDVVGTSTVHIKRDAQGVWGVVSPSPYNRRIYGDRPRLEFTGPRRGQPGIGDFANGSVGNCSGGVTPWGTVLSCEENYDGYGVALGTQDFFYGWTQNGGQPEDAEYEFTNFKKYGWVCEEDPYDPAFPARKHTALGRFRHENTAFRQAQGKKFVLYMGDDKANEGVYKFVSTRAFVPGNRAENMKILTEGQLYIARWLPQGRRTFATAGDTTPTSPTSGTGRWVPLGVEDSAEPSVAGYTPSAAELDDTAARLRERFGTARYDAVFATNRPEDVEVANDGKVYIALTNNSSVNDSHGSVRLVEEANADPEALTFTWRDYAAGGPSGRAAPGEQGFSSPDNLVFDKAGNVWVVTDISSSRLNRPTGSGSEYNYHGNNAAFMVPTSGPNAGVAFRFANMPVQAEGTGPYFTPDESTLFMAVQHPGEETKNQSASVFGDPQTYTSWWPRGNRAAQTGQPAEPLPSVVAITRVRHQDPGGGGGGGGGRGSSTIPPVIDSRAPRTRLSVPPRIGMGRLVSRGLLASLLVDEPGEVALALTATLGPARRRRRRRRGGAAEVDAARGRRITVARAKRDLAQPDLYDIRLKPRRTAALLLRRRRSAVLTLTARVTDRAGNVTRVKKTIRAS